MRRFVRLFGRLTVEQGPLVLVYHRIGGPGLDPWNLSVRPRNFAGHMRHISRRANPVGLETMMQRLFAGTLAPNSVAVTFDDGYGDNLHLAAPVLSRYSIPATVFVTTGNIGLRREFWWDEIERIVSKTTRPLHTLPSESRERDRVASAHTVYQRLWEDMKSLDENERWSRLEDIRARADVDDKPRPSYLPLSGEELIELSGLVEIGAHTVTHPDLSELPEPEQRVEIGESKSCLEDLLSRRVGMFSYPHGACSQRSVEIVGESGFDYAYALTGRSVDSGCDPLHVPRVMIGDWSEARFGIWLDRWLGAREARVS